MGQKTNPNELRLNRRNTDTGDLERVCSKWYAVGPEYAKNTLSDIAIHEYLAKHYSHAGIAKLNIERFGGNPQVTVWCVRHALLIGKGGSNVQELNQKVSHHIGEKVHVILKEIKKPELFAKLVAENCAAQIEKRVSVKKAMKREMEKTMRSGAIGIRIIVSGRIGGADIARSEKYQKGRVPLHTFKADIGYHVAEALTTYGILGIKVWIYKDDKKTKKKA